MLRSTPSLDSLGQLAPLLLQAGYAVLATCGAVAALLLLGALFRRLATAVRERLRAARAAADVRAAAAGRLWALLGALLPLARVAATLLVLAVYVPLVFSFFAFTRGWSEAVLDAAAGALSGAALAVAGYLPSVAVLALLVLATRWLLQALAVLFAGLGSGRFSLAGFHKDWAPPTYTLVRALVFALAAVVAFPYLPGADSPGMKGISLFLGVLLSLGSGSAVSNAVAGTILTYMRGLHPGDRVRVGDAFGDVVERTLLVTRIRTTQNVLVTIPNSTVLNTSIWNYSSLVADGGLMVRATVTIGYDVPWRQVHALLIAAGRATPGARAGAEPYVLQRALGDYNVAYELNLPTDRPNAMERTLSDLHANIQDEFAHAGVEILSPAYTALRDGSPPILPREPKAGSAA